MGKKFRIKVITKAKKAKVLRSDGDIAYLIKVHSPREKGKANKEALRLISEFLNIKQGMIKIIKGEKSIIKTIEIINQ